ncbi:MAG: flagellar basal body P-ring formation chaperone FlgA [Phycisphaeraceae bacterium]
MLLLAAGSARAGLVYLRPETRVDVDVVTLADVAELHGEYAQSLGDVEILRLDAEANDHELTRRRLRSVLGDAGVHWGRLTIRGRETCMIRRAAPAAAHAAASDAEAPVERVDAPAPVAPSPGTLGARIERLIVDLADAEREALRIRFRERDADRLALPLTEHRFELQPATVSGVGRVPVMVQRYEGDRELDRFTIMADVERRVTALVATQTIGRGQRLGREHFERRELYLDVDRGEPLADFELIRGRHADAVLREGTVLYPDHVRSPTLVRRGERITVRATAGELMVRTSARADDTGAMGDIIAVRNERTRQGFLVRITGRRQAVVHVDTMEPQDP